MPADNVRTLIVTVKDKIEVLLVNGKSAAKPFDRATEYVLYALDPYLTGSTIRPYGASADRVQLMTDRKLLSYDAMFFADVAPN